MNKTKTTENLGLELPPQGGNLTLPQGSLEDEAHALRVMLDRSENMKVAVGHTLLRLLKDRFAGNRNALQDWYELEIYQGKEHRAWNTVRKYLQIVNAHGENASEVLAQREEADRAASRERGMQHRRDAAAFRATEFGRDTDRDDSGKTTRQEKSEYERRADWLAQMNYYWFKGEPEWQNKWLSDRGLRRV